MIPDPQLCESLHLPRPSGQLRICSVHNCIDGDLRNITLQQLELAKAKLDDKSDGIDFDNWIRLVTYGRLKLPVGNPCFRQSREAPSFRCEGSCRELTDSPGRLRSVFLYQPST